MTIPIYTIIIHVGQLVDLDIVIEARIKASKKSDAVDLTSVLVAPGQLRRASTLMLISRPERIRLQVSVIVFGSQFQMLLFWAILLHSIIVMTHYFDSWQPHLFLPFVTPLVPIFFVAEMSAKWYAAGSRFFTRSLTVMFDVLIVVLAFGFVCLYEAGVVSPVCTTVILLRIYQIVRVSRIGRLMRHQQEDIYEANLDECEIELQMQKTKDKIAETILESDRLASHFPESGFALSRARSLSLSRRGVIRSLHLDFEDGKHCEVPVQTRM